MSNINSKGLTTEEFIRAFKHLCDSDKRRLLDLLFDTLNQKYYTLIGVYKEHVRVAENLTLERAKEQAVLYPYYKVVLRSNTPLDILVRADTVEFKYKGQERK